MTFDIALYKVIHYCENSQKKLADLLGTDADQVSYWANRAKCIPFHYAVGMEWVTEGLVSRYELAPYARFQHPRLLARQTFERSLLSAHVFQEEPIWIGQSAEGEGTRPEKATSSLVDVLQHIFKHKHDLSDLFHHPQLTAAEQRYQLPLKLLLLCLVEHSNGQGYFSLDFHFFHLLGGFLQAIDFNQALKVFIEMGLVVKVKIANKSYGKFLLAH